MDFHDFPRILGKSGCVSHPPPPSCVHAYSGPLFRRSTLRCVDPAVCADHFRVPQLVEQGVEVHLCGERRSTGIRGETLYVASKNVLYTLYIAKTVLLLQAPVVHFPTFECYRRCSFGRVGPSCVGSFWTWRVLLTA